MARLKMTKKTKKKDQEERVLKNILIAIGVIFLLVAGFYGAGFISKTSHYEDLKFEHIKYGELDFYRTEFFDADGNVQKVSIRSPVKFLKEIPFENENFSLMKNTLIDTEGEISCEGDEVIAIANLERTHSLMGINFFTNESLGCDGQNRYLYLNLIQGNETKIEAVSETCYNLYFKDCEILPVTEKLIAEIILEYNSL